MKTLKKCGNNFVQGWKTTTIGIFLFAIGVGLLIDQRESITNIQAISFGAITMLGVVFLFIPDTFVDALQKYLKKYAEK